MKSYLSAVFGFRLNVWSFIQVVPKGQFPMSPTPMESLLVSVSMVSVDVGQSKSGDRLSFAIPTSDLLSYHDSRVLADAITISELQSVLI